jgi:hypothetical protein
MNILTVRPPDSTPSRGPVVRGPTGPVIMPRNVGVLLTLCFLLNCGNSIRAPPFLFLHIMLAVRQCSRRRCFGVSVEWQSFPFAATVLADGLQGPSQWRAEH